MWSNELAHVLSADAVLAPQLVDAAPVKGSGLRSLLRGAAADDPLVLAGLASPQPPVVAAVISQVTLPAETLVEVVVSRRWASQVAAAVAANEGADDTVIAAVLAAAPAKLPRVVAQRVLEWAVAVDDRVLCDAAAHRVLSAMSSQSSSYRAAERVLVFATRHAAVAVQRCAEPNSIVSPCEAVVAMESAPPELIPDLVPRLIDALEAPMPSPLVGVLSGRVADLPQRALEQWPVARRSELVPRTDELVRAVASLVATSLSHSTQSQRFGDPWVQRRTSTVWLLDAAADAGPVDSEVLADALVQATNTDALAALCADERSSAAVSAALESPRLSPSAAAAALDALVAAGRGSRVEFASMFVASHPQVNWSGYLVHEFAPALLHHAEVGSLPARSLLSLPPHRREEVALWLRARFGDDLGSPVWATVDELLGSSELTLAEVVELAVASRS